jgi:uncharacterized membrane protein
MKTAIFFALLACLFYACSPVNKFFGIKDDNVVEEMAEEVIKIRTGLDLDLTPESKEIK